MNINELVDTFPMFWKIFIVLLIIFANIIYLFRKFLLKIKFVRKFSKTRIKNIEHKIFTESSFIKHQINRIDLNNERKTKIFREILLIKYESIKKYSKLLIENRDVKDLSNKQFYAFVIKNMTSIVKDYNEKIKNKFGDKIYDLIMMDKEKGFNNVHEKTIIFIKNIIEETFETDHVVYSSVEDKIDFLLDLYFIAMKIAMTDVDKIYKNFNGDLDILLKKCKNCN